MRQLCHSPNQSVFLLGLGLSLLFLVSLNSASAENQEIKEFVPGEFVISNPYAPLQLKTVEEIEQESNKSVAVIDSSRVGIKIATERSYNIDQDERAHMADVDVCKLIRMSERKRRLQEKQVVRRLARLCERNTIIHAADVANDPLYSSMWGFQRLQMPTVWSSTKGSRALTVAVLDTGVNYNISDLSQNIWTNPLEVPGNGVDDDNNGYVDDVHGVNFIDNSGDPQDDNGHGTHVAGTIGARTNNGVGVSGMSWNITILPLKFLGANGSGTTWGAVNALSYVRAMKVRANIIATNNSWGGGPYSQALYDEIQRLKDDDILFVAAAGNAASNNETTPFYPASYNIDNIISVAAIQADGTLATFSNYGATSVDLAAPGVNIASTWKDGSFQYLSGTSMATPHVTGAVALLKAYSGSLTGAQIRNALLASTIASQSLSGKVVTGGELSLLGALAQVPSSPYAPSLATPVPTATTVPTATATPTVTPPSATPTPTATPNPGNWTLRVYNDTGLGVGGVQITVSGPNGYASTGQTASDGTLTLNSLQGGSYTVQFSKSGYEFSPPTLSSIVDGNTVSIVTALKTTYTVQGVVMDKTNAYPLSQAVVQVVVDGTVVNTLTTGSDGVFSAQLAYGDDYQLEVTKGGFYTVKATGEVTGKTSRTVAMMPN